MKRLTLKIYTIQFKMTIISAIVWLFYAYLLMGLLFATWFIAKGVNTVDEGMRHTGWNVRILLIPGSVLLWVVLMKKYLRVKAALNN